MTKVTKSKLRQMRVHIRFLDRHANPHVHPLDMEELEDWRDSLRGLKIGDMSHLEVDFSTVSQMVLSIEALLMVSGIEAMARYA